MGKLDEYQAAVANGFDVPMPRAEDYGLDRDLSPAEFEDQIEQIQNLALKKGCIRSLVIAIPIVILIGWHGIELALLCIIAWIGCSMFIAQRLTAEAETELGVDSIRRYLQDKEQWLRIFNDWTESRSETGLKYWLNFRGVAFEMAVKRMLEKRGLNAEMTKGSGDGGIDLIVSHQGDTWWCQCKGHAKPIPVAPVREIAGVCGRSQATPVIFSANGFTKPAAMQADALGVICVDGYGLVKLAKNSDLAQSDWLKCAEGNTQILRV